MAGLFENQWFENDWYKSGKGWASTVVGLVIWGIEWFEHARLALEVYRLLPSEFAWLPSLLSPICFVLALIFFGSYRKPQVGVTSRAKSKKLQARKVAVSRVSLALLVIILYL